MRNVRYLILFAIVLLLLSACGGGGEAEPTAEVEAPMAEETEQDEVLTATEDVPEVVRIKADTVLALIGEGVSCTAWYWDAEDDAWECEIAGDDHAAELDLTPDGGYSELEYEFTGEEVLANAPVLAEMIESACDDPAGAVVELSMRREEFLAQDPDLAAWWEEEGLLFEVECPDGYGFEVDAFGVFVTDDDDDVDKD